MNKLIFVGLLLLVSTPVMAQDGTMRVILIIGIPNVWNFIGVKVR